MTRNATLYYVAREQHRYTIDQFLSSLRRNWPDPPRFIRCISYETLFALKRAPIGNYVFTDIDRLSGYEIDAAGEVVKGLVKAAPGIRIANQPQRVLGRYALLRRLFEAGINSFNVWRLDEERAPDRYPVFLRREQDALGPESDLLHNEAEFRAAIAALQDAGKGLAGRIAVQYVPYEDATGVFRKFGAFNFSGRVVPQHLMLADSWVVKRGSSEITAQRSTEELDYVQDNPHAEHLRRIFRIAEIDFGRVDYCIADDRIEIFEINTNPNLPRARIDNEGRQARRKLVIEAALAGFADLNAGCPARGLAKFHYPHPKLHRLRDRALWRRLNDRLEGLRWRLQAL